jgi:large subunit ribosomal protein L6
MSRVGKKVIQIDKDLELKINGNVVSIVGPKGSMSTTILEFITIKNDNQNIEVLVEKPNDKFQKSVWGTTRAILSNMVIGVTKGFSKSIELNGVGYKMELANGVLTLYIGFSHPVKIQVNPAINLVLVKNSLTGTSYDKQLLNNFFGNLHEMKPCEPYKHKGFKFPGRFYIKKVGKKSGKSK